MPIKVSPSFSVEKAHWVQLQLSKKVIREDMLPTIISCVAGIDISYAKGMSIGAVAVLDFTSLKIIELQAVYIKTKFPYLPTLLSFREVAPALLAIKKLQVRPDVFLVDGHGIAHPYRFGFASHLGLVANVATIGVAKNLLCGEIESFDDQKRAPIKHEEEIIGTAIMSKPECKPIYVSVGHQVSLERAIGIVKNCTRTSRIPEPIRKAHVFAAEEKRKLTG